MQPDLHLGWEAWPHIVPVENQQINSPIAMELDLNEVPMGEDPIEMIINPAQENDIEEELQIEVPPPQILQLDALAVEDVIPFLAHFSVMQVQKEELMDPKEIDNQAQALLEGQQIFEPSQKKLVAGQQEAEGSRQD
jgi:hypothetical protein